MANAIPESQRPVARRKGDPGRYLLDRGLITEAQYDEAKVVSSRTGKSFGRVLLELGYISEGKLTEILAQLLNHEFVDLSDFPIDPIAATTIPEPTARRLRAVPIGFEDDSLVVAMSDPTQVVALDDIRHMTGRPVRVVVAKRQDIEDALDRIAAMDRSAENLLQEAVEPEEEELAPESAPEEAPIVKAINGIIADAVKKRASDIHLEPQEGEVRIRYRIDGVLHDMLSVPKRMQAGMVSRLKVMAELNIAERRIPQDGRISIKVDRRPIDLRVATLPAVWGEKVVMRILDGSAALLDLDELGFLPDTLVVFEKSFRKPYGAILVTGPTGSGKSTTLYSTLKLINTADRNIITVEDPVEYRLSGITQVQINPKAGLSWASALRSILRADPDVLMVGEMRDRETARIGVEAALTGHLVLSTLHTNDAPSAVNRLVEMGVEPFLVGSSLDCVLAQRLARKLCDRCKEPYIPSREALAEHGIELAPDERVPELYRARGCQHCSRTGFRGRLALVEVMPVTEEIERLTVEHRPTEDIRRAAIAQGMRPLRDDGIEKAKLGMTSIEEVLRVVV